MARAAPPDHLLFGGRYSLVGAVVHSGSGANFGHYVAIANVRGHSQCARARRRLCRFALTLSDGRRRRFEQVQRSGSCLTTIMFPRSARLACQVTSHGIISLKTDV